MMSQVQWRTCGNVAAPAPKFYGGSLHWAQVVGVGMGKFTQVNVPKCA